MAHPYAKFKGSDVAHQRAKAFVGKAYGGPNMPMPVQAPAMPPQAMMQQQTPMPPNNPMPFKGGGRAKEVGGEVRTLPITENLQESNMRVGLLKQKLANQTGKTLPSAPVHSFPGGERIRKRGGKVT